LRFMMLMIPKGYEAAAPGTIPDAEAVAAMMKYNESLQKAGVLLALDGLHPPSMGARVSFSGGKPKVTDGPFAEAKEVLGGYWMIQVKSKEEAIEWASRCPASDNEVIEIRQVMEMSDFPADVQKAGAKFPEMQARSGQRGGRNWLNVPRVDADASVWSSVASVPAGDSSGLVTATVDDAARRQVRRARQQARARRLV
jgi:hypothetical protein